MRIDPAKAVLGAAVKYGAPLLAARFAPAGDTVIATAQDFAVLHWTVGKPELQRRIGHTSWVRAIAFSSQHQLLLTGDYHGQLLLWPLADLDAKPIQSIPAHDGWLRACAVNATGDLAATCGNDGLVQVFQLPEGKLRQTLRGHDCHVYQVAFHPGGILASADLKGRVRLWNAEQGTLIRELDGKELYKYDEGFRADIGGARSLRFSPDGKWLVASGITEVSNAFAGVGQPCVLVFDVEKGERRFQLKPKEPFQATAWGSVYHPDGFVIAAGGGGGGKLWFWEMEKGECVHTVNLPDNARDLDLSADGRRLVIPLSQGSLQIVDLAPAA